MVRKQIVGDKDEMFETQDHLELLMPCVRTSKLQQHKLSGKELTM